MAGFLPGDNGDYMDWLANQQGQGNSGTTFPTPNDMDYHLTGTQGITDPNQGPQKTPNAPNGLDRFGNPLPPPGAANFATTGTSKYDDSGNLIESSKTLNPAQGPHVSNNSFTGGDFRSWFLQQVQGKPWNQDTLSGLESVLTANGSKLTPANASGERTKIYDPTTGQWVRVGFGEATGGASPWSVWVGQGGDTGGDGGNTGFDYSQLQPTAPFQAGARQTVPQLSVLNADDPNSQAYQSLLDRLHGISTGSTSEFSNPNLRIDPGTDPIIKPQVEAYDAAQQRSTRRFLAAAAERQGSNANISAETRHAAEAGGQATAQYQAQLAQQELGARRQEIQSALNGEQGMLTARQSAQLQAELAKINLVEQQYQFDASLGEKAYEFDANQTYLNSPLAHL